MALLRSLTDQRLDLRLERGLLDLFAAHPLAHLDAALEEDERRASGDAEPLRELTVPLAEHLHEAGLPGELLRHRLELGRERLAGRTLGRVEVEHDGEAALQHLRVVPAAVDLLD